MFKLIIRSILLLFVLLFVRVTLTSAQGFSTYFGAGAATDTSNNQVLDSAGDIGPKMTGAFGVFGSDYMWKPQLGFGGEYSWRFSQGPYASLGQVNYRPAFFDFNVIYHPLGAGSSRIVPEFRGESAAPISSSMRRLQGAL